MKNLFLSVALIISTVLAKAQVNSTIYNDLKVRNNFSQKFTIQNLTEFNTAMTEIYGYNKSLGNYPNLPNLSTIISSSTFSLNGVIRFNDLNRGASNIRRLGGPNSTILLNTLNKYKSILETAIDYADFKTQITTELNNTPNSLQISFYNEVLAMGDLLEAKQNSVPFTGDKIICGSWWKCWGKCIFGIVGGAGLGGLGGAAGGSAVPVLGTIGGGIAGAIFGGISGASASCD